MDSLEKTVTVSIALVLLCLWGVLAYGEESTRRHKSECRVQMQAKTASDIALVCGALK